MKHYIIHVENKICLCARPDSDKERTRYIHSVCFLCDSFLAFVFVLVSVSVSLSHFGCFSPFFAVVAVPSFGSFVRFLLLFHYIVNNFRYALISFVQFSVLYALTLIVYSNVFELAGNNLAVFIVCLISCMNFFPSCSVSFNDTFQLRPNCKKEISIERLKEPIMKEMAIQS